jgi:hypothetical protein
MPNGRGCGPNPEQYPNSVHPVARGDLGPQAPDRVWIDDAFVSNAGTWCNAPPKTGLCFPSLPTTTRPPSGSLWHCGLRRSSFFHADVRGYGLSLSIMAVGTVADALWTAGHDRSRFGLLLVGAAVFGIGWTLSAIAPGHWLFAVAPVSSA